MLQKRETLPKEDPTDATRNWLDAPFCVVTLGMLVTGWVIVGETNFDDTHTWAAFIVADDADSPLLVDVMKFSISLTTFLVIDWLKLWGKIIRWTSVLYDKAKVKISLSRWGKRTSES